MQSKIDLLKSGNFSIVLKDQKTIELQVQEVNLPSVTLNGMQMNHFTQNFQSPGDSIEWSPINLTIICDEDLKAFKEVMNHILSLKDPETGDISNTAVFDATLMITTNKNNVNHTIRFQDCWFTSVSDLQLSSTTSEDDPITFTIDVSYTRWFFE